MPLLARAAGIGVVVGVFFSLTIGMVAAPRIDERLGFFTSRALRAVRSYPVEGVKLHRVVAQELQAVRWRAYHQDIPFQTFVECVGTPYSGGPERRMLWYVEERPVWNDGPSLKIVTMTALNNEAMQLTPLLFDPRAGFGLEYGRKDVEPAPPE